MNWLLFFFMGGGTGGSTPTGMEAPCTTLTPRFMRSVLLQRGCRQRTTLTRLELYRGDSVEFDTVPKDKKGNPVPPEEIAAIWFTVKRNLSDPDAFAVIAKSLGSGIAAVADALDTDNVEKVGFRVSIAPGDTDSLISDVPQQFEYSLKIKDLAMKVKTTEQGTLTIYPVVKQGSS